MEGGHGSKAYVAIPLYQQLKLVIERKIATGEWTPGSPIPTEPNLIKEYGISRTTTVRQALDELVKKGRIYRKRGRGTFVAPPKIAKTPAHLTGFAEELTLRGLVPIVTVLAHRVIPASTRIADALQMPSQKEVLHIRRLVTVDERPLFVDDNYFPMELLGILGVEKIQVQPIYQLLKVAGRVPAEGEQWLEAVPISEELAGYLEAEPGMPQAGDHPRDQGPHEYSR